MYKELRDGVLAKLRQSFMKVVCGGIFVIAIIFGISAIVAADNDGSTSARRIVTIYDSGEEKTILTTAATIEGALEEAEIVLEDIDKVEPSRDTELVANSYSVNIYRSKPVLVIDGDYSVRVISASQSGRTIATDAGIELYPEDLAEINNGTDILANGGAGQIIRIKRAYEMTLVLYGQERKVRSQASTVEEFLEEKGLALNSDDTMNLGMGSHLSYGMTLKIWREGINTITVEEEVPFKTEYIHDADREVGYRSIQAHGISGKRSVTYKVNIRDGKEVSPRVEIQSLVLVAPINQIEVVGAKSQGIYTTPSENENITWDYLRAQGFSREQTAGIMGNLKQEHGFQTSGDGLAQWTGGRKARLMAMNDPYSIYTQLDFLMIELNGGYVGAKNAILASSTVEEATIIFQDQFERCGICVQDRRIQYAHDILVSH